MLLEARELRFAYGGRPILDGIDLAVPEGEMSAILGPNGAGKSTLLKILAGLCPPQSGSVYLDGKRLEDYTSRTIAQRIAMVSREVNHDVPFTVREIVSMGRTPHLSFLGLMGSVDREKVAWAMARMEVTEFSDRRLTELSSGEAQRVLIAMALAQDTPILLLDEPTAFLDLKHQLQILSLLQALNREEKRTILAVTHDLNLAAMFFHRIFFLKSGKIPTGGFPDEVLTPEHLRSIFGVDTVVETRKDTNTTHVFLKR